jgi:hypothetical protein
MSAALAPTFVDPADTLTPQAILRANVTPAAIDLGTSVRVNLWGARTHLDDEGVVIEVVPRGAAIRSARVWVPASHGFGNCSSVPRYVVQCWERRVIRRAGELAVVSL